MLAAEGAVGLSFGAVGGEGFGEGVGWGGGVRFGGGVDFAWSLLSIKAAAVDVDDALQEGAWARELEGLLGPVNTH